MKYSLNASAILAGSVTCSPLTKIAVGAFGMGLIGADCFNSFHRFLVLCHVLWTRMLTLDRWTKMVGDHERFFLTTFLILLKVSDDWALPDYLPTIRNIYGNHGQNYLIK